MPHAPPRLAARFRPGLARHRADAGAEHGLSDLALDHAGTGGGPRFARRRRARRRLDRNLPRHAAHLAAAAALADGHGARGTRDEDGAGGEAGVALASIMRGLDPRTPRLREGKKAQFAKRAGFAWSSQVKPGNDTDNLNPASLPCRVWWLDVPSARHTSDGHAGNRT